MKSHLRCKENYQGDRCKLALDHTGEHKANFHTWGTDKLLAVRIPEVLEKAEAAHAS